MHTARSSSQSDSPLCLPPKLAQPENVVRVSQGIVIIAYSVSKRRYLTGVNTDFDIN